jgi:hypothetical protein
MKGIAPACPAGSTDMGMAKDFRKIGNGMESIPFQQRSDRRSANPCFKGSFPSMKMAPLMIRRQRRSGG